MAEIREGSQRIATKSISPCLGQIPNELLGIGQMPSVKVPSVFDDAVQSAKTLEDKLKVNIDSLLTKAEEIQKEIQGAFGEITSGIQSAFESVESMILGSGSTDCVALGVPDPKKLDSNAFGGGIGAAMSIPSDSGLEDDLQAQIGQQLEAPTPALPELGSGLPQPTQAVPTPTLPTGIETTVLEAETFEVPTPPDTLDGGGF